jgi:iron complex transport system substrate-binding protein
MCYGSSDMKKYFILILAALALAGCAKTGQKATLTDRAGNQLALPGELRRVVSAAPSNTEIMVDLGLADRLVAADVYSGGIAGVGDGVVRIDFAWPDAETILAVKPDLILATGLNRTERGDDPFAIFRGLGIPVAYLPTSASVTGIYEDIAFIAQIFGVPERGQALIADMKRQVDEIARQRPAGAAAPTVYFEVSPAPQLVSFGSGAFLNNMIELAGGKNIFANKTGWFAPGEEAIIAGNPNVILTNVSYIDDPLGEIRARPGFEHISAVQNNRIYLIDTDSSSRPSSRIGLALVQISRALYPEAYAP